MKKHLKFLKLNLAELILMGSVSVYFLSTAFTNPDPQHDGIQFTSGVAVAEGKIPHLDFFEQYGPFNAIFHGVILYIMGNEIWILRFQTVAILAITAFLIVAVLRLCKTRLTIRIIVILIWALSSPVTSLTSNIYGLLPWPSLLTQAMTLFITLLLIKISKSDEMRIPKNAISVISLLSFLILTTRFQVGVILVILVNWTILNLKFNRQTRRKMQVKYLKSLGVYLSVFVIVGVVTKSFLPFISQIVIGPFGAYVNEMNWGLMIGFLRLGIVLAILYFTVFLVSNSYLHNALKALIFVILFLAASFSQIYHQSDQLKKSLSKFFNINLIPVESQLNFMALVFLVLILLISRLLLEACGVLNKKTYMFMRIEKYKKNGKYKKRLLAGNREERYLSELGITTILTIPSLSLLYPLPSTYHFWWSFGACVIPIGVFSSILFKKNLDSILLALAFPTLLSLTLLWNQSLQRDWVELDSGAFKHMKIEQNYIQSFEQVDQILTRNPKALINSTCFDSLFVSWNGSFNSSQPRHVSWAFGMSQSSLPGVAELSILCSDDQFAMDFATKNKVRITNRVEYNLSWWSKGIMFEYESLG